MSTSQEHSNATVMLAPDMTMVSDDKDEEVVDLEAVAREATAKLEKDLAEVKARNDGIVWKKQEQANQLVAAKKRKEDEAAEAQRKADEEAKKSR